MGYEVTCCIINAYNIYEVILPFIIRKSRIIIKQTANMKKILCIWVLTVTFLGAFPALADAQQWGLTANGLYWATATPNIGVEYAFHSKMSIAGLVQYNPFTYAKNRKMKHLAGQLEYRYWLSDVFMGHYLGVHATGGIFNFGNLPLGILKDYRLEGQLYGGGLTYGYQWIISNRVNIGVDIGLGYLYVDYDKFYCPTCGERVDHYRTNYLGPTKVGVSIIYLLK